MVESTGNAAAEVFLEQLIDYTYLALEIIITIIIIIIVGITLAGLVRIFILGLKKKEGEQRPTHVHQLVTRMLRGLLIALDFLVAADILKTILVPSVNELAILVIIVVIRILLSWSLSKEIEGQPR